MDITITHKPLNQEEITALGGPLRRIVGIDWMGHFTIVFFLGLLLAVFWHEAVPLLLVLFGVAFYFAMFIPSIAGNKSLKANIVLKYLAATPLFPVEHQFHLTEEVFSVALPDFELTFRYDAVPQTWLTHVSSTGDELLFLEIPGYPILRKSDFENPADFAAVLGKLQSNRKGA